MTGLGGVTIVLTKNTSDYATVQIGNGFAITLRSASPDEATLGQVPGVVFFGDRNAPHSNSIAFNGGSAQNFTGALYFPTQTVVYSNGTTSTSQCTQLIAWHIQFQGGSRFNSACTGTGVSPIGAGTASQLVE